MDNNQTAARSARRFLDERIRTDWSYPSLPAPWEHSDEEVRHATAFRERYYGDSESSDSDADSTINTATTTAAATTEPQDAYKFDTPDAIADAVQRARAQRRARRRKRLEAEMQENEGLRVWVQRRDAWTGVASVRKYGVVVGARNARGVSAHDSGVGVGVDSVVHADTTDTQNNTVTDMDMDKDKDKDKPLNPDLTPLAPPLLPQNPIRKSITPSSYPDIYTKIVTSSRTPSVPINLADMTRALVQGWKDTNEWPPKVGGVDPLAGRRRVGGLAGLGGGVLGRHTGRGVLGALGGGLGGAGSGGGKGNGNGNGNGEGGFIHRHPHLEKGVGSVRKILHLSGGHAGANGNGNANAHAHAHAGEDRGANAGVNVNAEADGGVNGQGHGHAET